MGGGGGGGLPALDAPGGAAVDPKLAAEGAIPWQPIRSKRTARNSSDENKIATVRLKKVVAFMRPRPGEGRTADGTCSLGPELPN